MTSNTAALILSIIKLAEDLAPEAVALILALAKSLLDIALMGIDHLSQEGVLHIKNPASRSTASALILSLRGIVRTAQALLQ